MAKLTRIDETVIAEDENKTLLQLVLENKFYLSGADLGGADLGGADLSGANLIGADLRGANLIGADLRGADLIGANLTGTYLRGANLSEADLSEADLSRTNLRGANLREADLIGANLRGADLCWANLIGAKGLNPFISTPLMMLFDQPGLIRAYKLVKENGEGPFNGGIVYKVGETFEERANIDFYEQCAEGINLATLDWCLKEYKPGYRILVAEFTAQDIAAIPIGSDGKFRVHRCKIVGEKTLEEVGLVQETTNN